jgi:hypothetical protein
MIRSGIGFRQNRMEGLGNLASTSTDGGVDESAFGGLLNMPRFFMLGNKPDLNVCALRAKASALEGGGRGGSIGINLKPVNDLLFSFHIEGRCTVTLT